MKQAIFLLMFPFVFLSWTGTLKADLLGDTIQFDYATPDQNSSVFSESIVVVEGATDEVGFTLIGDTFLVDPESDFIVFRLDFVPGTFFAGGEFNGAIISDLDFADGQSLVGFTFETDFAEFDADRISFTSDSLAVNFSSIVPQTGSEFVRVNLITVPEPNSCILMTMAALLAFRRSKPI